MMANSFVEVKFMDLPVMKTLLDDLRDLYVEVDCRVEHGAASGGHLEYVHGKLKAMLARAFEVAECDLADDGTPVGY